MALHFGQVTIPAGGKVALITTRTPAYELIVQKNSANAIRVGDSTVTATTGIAVAASNAAPGPAIFGPFTTLAIEVSQVFVFGTQNDVVDFAYTK